MTDPAATSYPLCWPVGWPRHAGGRKRPNGSAACGFVFARDKAAEEIRRIKAEDPILSTNCRLLLNGQPRGDERPIDPGVAIYFTLNGRPMVMATDYFSEVGSNIWRLAMSLAYLRGLERHGGGTMLERAFAGFAALPDPNATRQWWSALGLPTPDGQTAESIKARYLELARKHHPDVGGSDSMMVEITAARDAGMRAVGGQ